MSGQYIRQTELNSYLGLKWDFEWIECMIELGAFPAPVKRSPKSRIKVWLKSEVEAWEARRVAERLAYSVSIGGYVDIEVTVARGRFADRLKNSTRDF